MNNVQEVLLQIKAAKVNLVVVLIRLEINLL